MFRLQMGVPARPRTSLRSWISSVFETTSSRSFVANLARSIFPFANDFHLPFSWYLTKTLYSCTRDRRLLLHPLVQHGPAQKGHL